MAEAFIVRRGGGGSGGTLVVTSSGAGTVTVSNSTLGKSYSKSVTAGGSVTFKGLKSATWTVKLSNGTQTSTKTVNVTADYSTSIAYFSATISVTYPAGSTCAITTDPTNYSDIIFAGDTSGHWSFTVPYAGNWIVASYTGDISNPDKIVYKAVNITADGQSENVTLSYRLYLYKNGDKCTDVGGDWSLKKGYTDGVSVTYNTDYAQLNVRAVTSEYMGNGFWYKNLDITNYSKLCAIVTYNAVANSGNLFIAVCNSATDTPISSNVARKDIGANDVSATVPFELDISSITGSKYIGIGTHMAGTGSGTAKIKEVYLV